MEICIFLARSRHYRFLVSVCTSFLAERLSFYFTHCNRSLALEVDVLSLGLVIRQLRQRYDLRTNCQQMSRNRRFGSGSTAFGRIRIHFNPRFGSRSGSGSTSISFLGSGSTHSKCGSQDPHPLFRKGGSEDPDPLFPNVDPRIRIHVKMRWI